MTLQEHIEGLAQVRERYHQDAARLTIELAACEDVLHQTTRTESYHHAMERRIYTEAYNRAVDLLRVEGEGT